MTLLDFLIINHKNLYKKKLKLNVAVSISMQEQLFIVQLLFSFAFPVMLGINRKRKDVVGYTRYLSGYTR